MSTCSGHVLTRDAINSGTSASPTSSSSPPSEPLPVSSSVSSFSSAGCGPSGSVWVSALAVRGRVARGNSRRVRAAPARGLFGDNLLLAGEKMWTEGNGRVGT